METLYDIYFAGRLVEGFEAGEVRENLVKLFKLNDVALEKLFSGKPQPIKRGVDKAGAIKYKTAMARAGAVAAIKAHRKADSKTAAGTPAPPTAFTLAPEGSAVLTDAERTVVEVQDIDTSAIQMVSTFTEPEPIAKEVPPAPDTSHLSMGEPGEDIPHLEIEQELLDLDTSHLSMGEPGEDIPHLEVEQELLNPDTSGISLAPGGSDVLEEQYKHHEQAQPLSTDHLTLQE